MQAFHNDATIKSAIMAGLAVHRAADELVQGSYWENGKGCAVGCTLETIRVMKGAKTIDHFTVGVIGNYTQQISDDKIGGHTVAAVNDLNSEGSQVDHVLIGPLLGYDFGSFSVTARFLYALHAENDQDNSFFHVGFTVPIKF